MRILFRFLHFFIMISVEWIMVLSFVDDSFKIPYEAIPEYYSQVKPFCTLTELGCMIIINCNEYTR